MHIKIIFFRKPLINFFTKRTLIGVILLLLLGDLLLIGFFIFIRHLDKLILDRLKLFRSLFAFSLITYFDRFLIIVFLIITASTFYIFHLLLNSFYDLRSNIFQKGLNWIISNLASYNTKSINSSRSNVIILIINIFNDISNSIFIIFT